MVPLALSVASRQPARTAAVWLLTAAAILFITAKTQHALWGIFPAVLLAWRRRFVPAALLLIAEVCIIVTVSPLYSVQGLFNVIFSKLAPQAPAPQQALRELGLGEDTFRYIGTNCYSPGSPFNTAEAMLAFNRRTSFGMVAHYWLRHPAEAFKAARGDLVNRAHDLRPPNLSNFRRQDGHPPFALTTRFASWSNLRSKMLRRWPVHIVAWYLLVIGVATGILFSRRPLPGPAVICLGIAAMGVLEFLLAALFDAVENERHLFLFHFMTDITICFAAAWALDAIMQVWKLRGSVMERSNSALVQVKSS
jgi:hypothetical protein